MKKSVLLVYSLVFIHIISLAQGYRNPVIAGFHPDPSICRVDSDYYLVNSSFEYFPGVPLFHSRDLVNWEQIGHVLNRKSQLDLSNCCPSGGIYAPTIRYNDGTFYMITTNITGRGNFLVFTKDPRGNWSDPIWLEQKGIDPSLYFEENKCYMVSNPDGAIWLCEIDPQTGKTLSPSTKIWTGTGGRYPEGPHIYHKDNFYYLMISEGGTEYGHKVTIARSKNIYGPYEANPNNPILTHINQNAENNSIQGTGHADLIQAHDGSWWAAFLGFRPQMGSHHLLGRETFMAPVIWDKDGWPVINGNGTVNERMNVKTLAQHLYTVDYDSDFRNSTLGLEWNYLYNPIESNYSLSEHKGYLRLHPSKSRLDGGRTPTFVGRRQTDMVFKATTRMELHTQQGSRFGISAYMSPQAHYDLVVENNDGVHNQLQLAYRIGKLNHLEAVCQLPDSAVYLQIRGTKDAYSFYYSINGKEYQKVGEMDTRYLSSETMGGFTGVYIGLFGDSYQKDSLSYADFDWVRYMAVQKEESPKLFSQNANPLLDFQFCADPTAVEYEGRLYVYATNDHQQYGAEGKEGRNTYQHIKSLVMMSTEDMVNWTYHGIIDVKKIAPWILNSWAPSVTSRKEKDGKTHFYLYFSNNGVGTGVLTATSPVGPWTSPLNHSLVDSSTPGLSNCPNPFDPGIVIDNKGTGWLTFGGGGSMRIAKLGNDLISIDSIATIPAPFSFEASELNFINNTWVYTYNTDWNKRDAWSNPAPKPSICCMSYMTSQTPLDSGSWVYQKDYFKNPGLQGFDYSNNHTHLHKYKGKWYLFYHTLSLQHSFNTDGGFRNVCVDEANVNESVPSIQKCLATSAGPTQIKKVNPFLRQQAETVFATQGIAFKNKDGKGNMSVCSVDKQAVIKVKGVNFTQTPKKLLTSTKGEGTIEVRLDSPDGKLLATVSSDSSQWKSLESKLTNEAAGGHDLYFIFNATGLSMDYWQFR